MPPDSAQQHATQQATPHAIPRVGLSAFYFAYFAYVGAFSPYFTLYLSSVGHGAAAIGMLLSAQQVMRIVAPNLWAGVADRTGRRAPWIRLTLAGAIIALAATFATTEFVPLLLVMAMIGLFTNAALPLFETLTFAHLRDDIGRYGVIRVWGSVGFIAAVLGVGAALDVLPIRALLWIVIALMVASLACACAVGDAPVRAARGDSGPLMAVVRQPKVMALLVACFFMCMAHGPLYAFYSIYLSEHGYGKTVVGVMWSIGVVAEILVFLFMPRLVKRYSTVSLFGFAFAVAVVRFLMIAWGVDSPVVLVTAQVMHAATFGVYHAAALGLLNAWFGDAQRSRAQALYMSVSFGAGGMLGGLGGGFLWESIGPAWTFSLASIASLAGWIAARRTGFPDPAPGEGRPAG